MKVKDPYTSLKPLGQIYRDVEMRPWRDMTTRERDVLIAEKVIGVSAMLNQHLDCPHYSTDIKAAWEVVEKLLKDGIRGYGANITLETRGDGSWSCYFYTPDSLTEEYAPTAPEAICLAALKAIGVDV